MGILHVENLSIWHTDGKTEAVVQWYTVFTSSKNASSCSLSLTRLRCFESRPWGSCLRAAVSVLTCGKVVGKSSCLDRDCRLEDTKAANKQKVRMWENIWPAFLAPLSWETWDRLDSKNLAYWLELTKKNNLLSEQLCLLCACLIWFYMKYFI